MKQLLEMSIIPSKDIKSALRDNKDMFSYFKGAFGKCTNVMITFITDPFYHGISRKFLAHHEDADVKPPSQPFLQTWAEPAALRDYLQFLIPNTLEMKKLHRIISIAFDSINLKGGLQMGEADIQRRKYYYIRAFYALMFFCNSDNHTIMLKIDSSYLSLIFHQLFDGVKSEIIPMHAGMMVSLFQFYRLVDPYSFYIEIIRNNTIYLLLMNIDNSRIMDFMISILGFEDK